MKILTAALVALALCAPTSAASAAGFQRVTVPDSENKPREVGIWYPSGAPAATGSTASRARGGRPSSPTMPSSRQAPVPGSSRLNVAAGGIDNRTENDKARLREPYQESGPGNVDYGFS